MIQKQTSEEIELSKNQTGKLIHTIPTGQVCFIYIGLSKDNTSGIASLSKESNGSTSGESSQEKSHYPLYVARFGYLATVDSDLLSFNKGDFFYIINDEADWWYAETRYPGEKGYIPSNYLKRYISLEAYRYVHF